MSKNEENKNTGCLLILAIIVFFIFVKNCTTDKKSSENEERFDYEYEAEFGRLSRD